mmetsp:Transcript_14295/g.53861  ORF Transcript_14295/g.53861 Transcript_14295/m.53861 type:complete len:235 (-) Transcript_14295:3500-4204(-)
MLHHLSCFRAARHRVRDPQARKRGGGKKEGQIRRGRWIARNPDTRRSPRRASPGRCPGRSRGTTQSLGATCHRAPATRGTPSDWCLCWYAPRSDCHECRPRRPAAGCQDPSRGTRPATAPSSTPGALPCSWRGPARTDRCHRAPSEPGTATPSGTASRSSRCAKASLRPAADTSLRTRQGTFRPPTHLAGDPCHPWRTGSSSWSPRSPRCRALSRECGARLARAAARPSAGSPA